jgi:hypothetical protein
LRWLAVLALASCVETAHEYRCASPQDCMLDGNAGRCEQTGHCSFPDPTCGPMGFRYHASAGDQAGICVLANTPITELPPFDLKQAHDDVHSSCAPSGARDVSFELTAPTPETIAFDTGTTATEGVALAVYAGPCPARTTELACNLRPCGPVPYGSLALTLMPGTYCVVVEEADPTGAMGTTALRVFRGDRESLVLDHPFAPPQQRTCGGIPAPAPPGCATPNTDPTAAAVFMICPGAFDLSATVTPDFDVAVSLREGIPMGVELDCKTGSTAQTVHTLAMNPGPYWMSVAHGTAPPACGQFQIMFSVTPH